MSKNYYLILGVRSEASREDIKAAFRRRALETHPDRSDQESEPFREVQEAYAVLGDPERRGYYDRRLRPLALRRFHSEPMPEPLVPERSKGEPMRAVEPARGFQDVSLAESFEVYRPSFGELFERLWGNFESVDRPKAEQLESLTVQVQISPDEARFGGQVRVRLPARANCSACGGQGAVGLYECWRCEGHGALTVEYPVEVEYPPGIRDSYAVRIPLARFGIANFYLTVLFRLSGGWD
jgi:molecular chaperone DnaJ